MEIEEYLIKISKECEVKLSQNKIIDVDQNTFINTQGQSYYFKQDGTFFKKGNNGNYLRFDPNKVPLIEDDSYLISELPDLSITHPKPLPEPIISELKAEIEDLRVRIGMCERGHQNLINWAKDMKDWVDLRLKSFLKEQNDGFQIVKENTDLKVAQAKQELEGIYKRN